MITCVGRCCWNNAASNDVLHFLFVSCFFSLSLCNSKAAPSRHHSAIGSAPAHRRKRSVTQVPPPQQQPPQKKHKVVAAPKPPSDDSDAEEESTSDVESAGEAPAAPAAPSLAGGSNRSARSAHSGQTGTASIDRASLALQQQIVAAPVPTQTVPQTTAIVNRTAPVCPPCTHSIPLRTHRMSSQFICHDGMINGGCWSNCGAPGGDP